MSKLWSYLVFLAWISYLLTSGLLIFIDGFFLTRVARAERSDCVLCEDGDSCDSQEIFVRPESAAQICPKPQSRVVLLVVDALKYEFLEWREDASSSSYHRNKLPIVREILRDRRSSSRLYRFVADPPTTTMQRLKGLMTGTLPTFIDAGSNFATDSVDEDNLIDQVAKRGKVVFMGDDTWTQLFPQKFIRQFPSPSLNVWDLDTVDREVRSRIAFELKKDDWSLLVAHTLGVDHCGHKHGQRHPEMARKLGDTDRLIREIVEAMGDDTVLFVVGDHGMTESGDHGGDSDDELEAGMFVYSKTPLVEAGNRDEGNRVNQIDLVPTLAAVLGIPIPFSNIGTIIVDSLPTSNATGDDRWLVAHAIWRNVVQTKSYIDAYSSDSFLFTEEKLSQINEMFDRLKGQIGRLGDAKSFEKFATDSRAFLKLIRDLCAEIWIQFDASSMSKGLLLVFCSLFFLYLLINNVPEERMNKIMESHFLRFAVASNAATSATVYALYFTGQIDEYKKSNFFATGVLSLSLLVILVLQNWDSISSTWYNRVSRVSLDYVTRGVLLLSFCALFSNSFVVEEDKVLSFLVVTTIALLLFGATSASTDENSPCDDRPKIKPGKNSMNPRKYRGLVILVALVGCAAVRVSSYFWRCREEQTRDDCANSSGKSASTSPEGAERVLLTGSLVLLALYITVVRIWLRNCGNLSGFSPSITVARYCPGVIVVCVGCFWVLQRLPKDARVRLAISWQINALPGIAYLFVLLGIFVLFARPLGVYLVPRRGESISVYEGEDIVPRLFDRVKELFYTKRVKEEPEVPVVYGLGTVYSAAFISLSVFVNLLWSLLLGNVLAPGTFMMFVTCTAVLGIIAVERFRNANSVAELLQIPSPAILCWFLIAEYFFYGTGHQPTFPTIHWNAAFIGTGGHFYGNWLPAILIGINTFGGHLIMALTLPLLAVVPFTVYVMMPELARLKFRVDDEMRKGELVLFERDSTYHNALFSIYGKYILLHGIRTFGCMMTATIHCRHLMVWKIFAPKLIFEGLSFLVTLGSVLASAFMVLRIDRQVDDLISRVTKIR